MNRGRVICATVVSLVISGCGNGTGNLEQAVVRDSAGIRIVENVFPRAADGRAWRVEAEPRVVIGSAAGAEETQLFRVFSARRAADGAIVIANSGTHEVRVFGPDGDYIDSFGQEGDGPGEFRMLFGAWPTADDSILTFDAGSRRVQVFTRVGEPARSLSLAGPSGAESLAGVLGDGSLVTYRTSASAPRLQRHIQSWVLYRRSASGEVLDSLATLEWREITPREIREGFFAMGAPVFSPVGQVAVGQDRIYLSDAKEPAVRVLDPTGRLLQIVRWSDHDRTVTEEDRDAFREERLSTAETDDQRRDLARMLDEAEWSDRFPALAGLRAAPDGRVWVRTFSRPGSDEPARWLVFSRAGTFEREVRVPEAFGLHEIGSDYLLGTSRDALGVEQVRLYPREVLEPEA